MRRPSPSTKLQSLDLNHIQQTPPMECTVENSLSQNAEGDAFVANKWMEYHLSDKVWANLPVHMSCLSSQGTQ